MEKTEAGDLEKHAFLHHNPTPAIQYSKTASEAKRGASDSQSACCGKKCCCCTISWKCCGITSAVILVIVGAIIGGGFLYLHILRSRLTGTASSEHAEEWETFLKGSANSSGSAGNNGDLITGEYVLVSYDENYPELLKAYGIPSFIVPFILESSETINLSRNGDRFKMVTITDWETKEYEFVNGEIFTVGWGRKDGVMHSNCTTSEPNKMICISEERKKGWKIIDESTFSTGGMIRNRHFVTADVRAKKFYQREGGQNDNSFGTGSDYGNLTILGGEDENYPFASDDEDYFAEFDTMDDDDDYDIMIES